MLRRIAWLALALLHLLPAIAMVRPSLLSELYGIDAASPAFPLVWHRAALFGVVMVIAIWASVRPEVRPLASVAVGFSMITFIAIAAPFAVMGAIDVLAAKYGAESRPGFDERTPLV